MERYITTGHSEKWGVGYGGGKKRKQEKVFKKTTTKNSMDSVLKIQKGVGNGVKVLVEINVISGRKGGPEKKHRHIATVVSI